MHKMRDRECRQLFKVPYATLLRRYKNNQNWAEGKIQLYLLEKVLYPENILFDDGSCRVLEPVRR
jgi:hypothetical protein